MVELSISIIIYMMLNYILISKSSINLLTFSIPLYTNRNLNFMIMSGIDVMIIL